jgi:hypothetical protein
VSKNPQEEPFSEADLASPEYRDRLMRKLNCLIAVLEVATAKVRKNMAGSPKDSERLARISSNLQSTLEVCIRARLALQRRQAQLEALPPAPPASAAPPPPTFLPAPERSTHGNRKRKGTDLTTDSETRKFAKLPPIDAGAITRCDFDDLARRLLN